MRAAIMLGFRHLALGLAGPRQWPWQHILERVPDLFPDGIYLARPLRIVAHNCVSRRDRSAICVFPDGQHERVAGGVVSLIGRLAAADSRPSDPPCASGEEMGMAGKLAASHWGVGSWSSGCHPLSQPCSSSLGVDDNQGLLPWLSAKLRPQVAYLLSKKRSGQRWETDQ